MWSTPRRLGLKSYPRKMALAFDSCCGCGGCGMYANNGLGHDCLQKIAHGQQHIHTFGRLRCGNIQKTIRLQIVKISFLVGIVLDSQLLLVMHVLRTMGIQFVTVAFAGKICNNVCASANPSSDTLCHNIVRFRKLCIGSALTLEDHTNDISWFLSMHRLLRGA